MTTATFNPTLDAYINAAAASSTDPIPRNGTIRLGGNDNFYRSLLRFSLGSIPTSALIISASLTIYNETTTVFTPPKTFTAYRLTQANWTAGVTWSAYDGSTGWGASGGDYSTPSAASSMAASTDNLVLSGLEQLISDAVANRSGVLDMIVVGPEVAGTGAYFTGYSVDYGTAALRPLLTVQYGVSTPDLGWTSQVKRPEWTA